MTRFFLTYDDVADLVVGAMEYTEGGEVFVYKMDAVLIEDLANAMIDTFAPEYGHEPDDIEITLTGRRVGETFDEKILTEREVSRAVESDTMYAITPEQAEEDGYLSHDGIDGFEQVEDVMRSSERATKLSKSQIIELLETEFQTEVGQ